MRSLVALMCLAYSSSIVAIFVMELKMYCAFLCLVLLHSAIGATGSSCLDKAPTNLMTQLFFNDESSNKVHNIACSALILTSHWLLAPASCLFDYNSPAKYQVKMQNSASNLVVNKVRTASDSTK